LVKRAVESVFWRECGEFVDGSPTRGDCLQGDVSFVFVVGSWSKCSLQCGHGGVQSRSVVCTLPGDGWALDVTSSFCDDRATPIRERDCGHVDVCPRWETAEWRQVQPPYDLSTQRSRRLMNSRKRRQVCGTGQTIIYPPYPS